ncbi:MAG: hypothetical protein DRI90_15985, partial [Deltaproteobacteria bacterium]
MYNVTMNRWLTSWMGVASLLISTACGDDSQPSGQTGTGGSAGAGAAGGGGSPEGGGGTGGDGGTAGSESPKLPPPDLGNWTGDAPIALVPSTTPPGDLSAADASHYGGLSCGPFPENLFDILIPNLPGPVPLVVFIHGGGFVGGTRATSYSGPKAQHALDYLAAGFGYATIDYRFRDALDEGVRTSLQDSQVCLQYIRYHAETLGIDPQRIVLTGGSAGAGTSLWLGTSDDLADPGSGHPILSVSTQVRGVIIDATQATYDLLDWAPVVFAPEYEELVQAAFDGGQIDDVLVSFYGISPDAMPSVVEFLATDPIARDYRAAIDMLELMGPDDAPVWAQTTNADE